MTFLNPLALFGLLAVAIPILLHILNLRKLRTIEFSTLSFLKELQRTRIRRFRIRQLLLLILRTLLIVFAVLALTRPTLRGPLTGFTGTQARTSAVILIDDTPSMNASNERGELFQQAKAAGRTVLANLAEGDEVSVIRLSSVGRDEPPPLLKDLPMVRRAFSELRTTFIHRTLEDGLRAAGKVIAGSRNVNKEIYILSDVQASSLEPAPANRREPLFDPQTRVFLIPMTAASTANAGIQEVILPNAIHEVGRPVAVVARVTNFSPQPMKNHVVSVFVDGTRVAQRGVDIPEGRSAVAEFTIVPQRSGWLNGVIELEPDDIDFDNRAFFSVHIPSTLRVLLAGSPQDVRYVRLALLTRQADSTQSIRISELTLDRLSGPPVHAADAMIIVNPGMLRDDQVQAIGQLLARGGGVILFPGPATTPATYQKTFGPLRFPVLTGINSASSKTGAEASFLEFTRVDLQHPIFLNMFERSAQNSRRSSTPRASQGESPVESPRVRMSARFVPSSSAAVIATLSDGSPFLFEQPIAAGRLLVFSVTPQTDWSDFPVRGMFAPLVHRAVMFAARQEETTPSICPGDEAVIDLQNPPAGTISVTGPSGHEEILSIFDHGLSKAVRLRTAESPGAYRLARGDETLREVDVNVDPRESDLTPAADDALTKLLEHLGIGRVKRVDRPDDIPRAVQEARYGTELWKYCLVAALLLGLAELAVARERQQDAVS